jgi:hypothetical protein
LAAGRRLIEESSLPSSIRLSIPQTSASPILMSLLVQIILRGLFDFHFGRLGGKGGENIDWIIEIV